MFQVYFTLGLEHILDLAGYDHMLFLLALCIPFVLRDGKKVLILATAFTIGHSVTLALSTLDLVRFPSVWVEFLIPLTILLTAIFDYLYRKDLKAGFHYLLAMFFGLIHGMGFSNFLRSSLFPGEESKLVWQLLSFNVGIEVGQIIVVIIFLFLLQGLFFLESKAFKSDDSKTDKNSRYKMILSIAVAVWAAYMCIDRWPL